MAIHPTSLNQAVLTGVTGITDDIDNQVRPGPAGSVNNGAFAPTWVLMSLMAHRWISLHQPFLQSPYWVMPVVPRAGR